MSIISPIASVAELDSEAEHPTTPRRQPGRFCDNEEVRSIIERGMACLSAAVPVHLSGPAGIGKTALAIRMAAEIGRPMSLLTGHEGLTHEDFVGREVGHSESVVVDKYIQSVRRKQTQSRVDWRDAMLVEAMRKGHTLIYDEFTRASPQANVVLLSVLEEGLLVSGGGSGGHSYVHAHPDFRIILTSNPSDYVAVNAAPDALLDRMVTFRLDGYSAETEGEIVRTATGLDAATALRTVEIVRKLRADHADALLPSIRTSMLIGRLARHAQAAAALDEARFETIVCDVVCGRAPEIKARKIVEAVRRTVQKEERSA